MEGDDDAPSLPPSLGNWPDHAPTLKRGMSVRLSAMQSQDDEEESKYAEDLVPDEYRDIQNSSMVTTRRPRRTTARTLPALQEDEDAEGDFIMEMHQTSTTEDSPYAVEDAIAFIRGVVDDNDA